MENAVEIVRRAARSEDRLEIWHQVFTEVQARNMCEVGVFKGDFARFVLSNCPEIKQYIMVDPWRQLPNWKKPANWEDDRFKSVFEEAMAKTEPFADKRVVLRDTTMVAADQIADGSLDVVYIDGDHTLRGITIDLLKMYPKVRLGGIIAGDDFTKNVWQHGLQFAPTEVFPFAVYFAEAMNLPIITLPYSQFAIVKDPGHGFEMVDLAGYADLDPADIYRQPDPPKRTLTSLIGQMLPPKTKASIKALLGR